MSTEIPNENPMIFRNRREAGRLLAERLEGYRKGEPVVLALPRGGVVVASEVARALGAPLGVVVARKLGAPAQPELAIGAVAPGGIRVLDEEILSRLGISEDELEWIAAREVREMERRARLFRAGRLGADPKGKTVILIDDGIATGMTVQAAIERVRQQEIGRLVLAVPVCAAKTAEALRPEVDELISLKTPPELWAIGYWYEDFEQVSDEEVVELLERNRGAGAM